MSVPHHPTTRSLALAGLAGPPLFGLSFVLQGALRSGYQPTRQPVSELALGPGGWVQTVSFLVLAACLAAGAVAVHRAVDDPKRSRKGPVLIGVAAACLVLSAVAEADPVGIAEPTATGGVHNLAFVVLMLALVAATVTLGRRMRGAPAWAGLGRVLPVFGLATVAGLVAFIGSGEPVAGVDEGLFAFGTMQRLLLVVAFGWTSVVAARVVRLEQPARATADGTGEARGPLVPVRPVP